MIDLANYTIKIKSYSESKIKYINYNDIDESESEIKNIKYYDIDQSVLLIKS